MATEACGGGISDLGFFLEVWVYMRGDGVDSTSGGVPGLSTSQGARPAPSWAARDSSGLLPVLRGLLLVQK